MMSRVSWSRDAAIYQVYVRSFADSDGDGTGDLLGVVSRLDYLADLGVDAIWLTPFYRSPMADGGYDVADYREVDPRFGTLADFDKLLVEAHARALKIVIDIVPNHCSSEHPWFQAALAAGPGSPERQRFHFRAGPEIPNTEPHDVGPPPNNWKSIFGGPAWTPLPDGEWYLHLFAPEQPDLNWDHPDVVAEFDNILRFWLDRGVDGVRIDVAHGMAKAPGLPDAAVTGTGLLEGGRTPYFDQDGVHAIYRRWRAILDSYVPERIAVAEAWLPDLHRIARYVRPDELHQAFNFDFLGAPWSGPEYRAAIDRSLTVLRTVGAPSTWVMSNHDVVRHATRLAAGVRGTAGGAGTAGDVLAQADATLGLRRARAAALLILALPGSVCLYQGEELGLPEVFDLPAAARQDPIFRRSGGAELGRDGCRVPLPWSGSGPPYGFGPEGSTPWLPQPAAWAQLSVASQRDDPASMLALYTVALRFRRSVAAMGDGEVHWLSGPRDDVLVFERPARGGGPAVLCAVNLGSTPAPLPSPSLSAPVLASGPLSTVAGAPAMPPDTAAWWTVH
jgi:alpha-glucosidase